MQKIIKLIFFLVILFSLMDCRLCFSNEEANIVGNKGLALIREGKVNDGLELMKQATQIDPEDASWHMNYASMLFKKGQFLFQEGKQREGEEVFREVEKELLAAIKLYKESDNMLKSQCYFLLGDTYFYALGNREKAKNYYQKAIENYPEHPGAKAALERFNLKFERPQIHFDGRNWEVGYEVGNNQQLMIEYVLEGETIHNWSELVTSNTFFGLQENMTPEQFMESVKKEITGRSPGATWNTIDKTDTSVMYEWEIINSSGVDNQHELARIISGKEGLHIVSYATKKVPVSSDRHQEWIRLLNSVTIEKK